MTPKQQREELSKAYVTAIAARCGFKLGVWSQDDDCLDVTIGAAGVLGGGILAGPMLDLQLKSSSDQRHVYWVDDGVESASYWSYSRVTPQGPVSVEVPKRQDFVDYDRRVVEIIEILTLVEQRPARSIIFELGQPGADVLSFRYRGIHRLVSRSSAAPGKLRLAGAGPRVAGGRGYRGRGSVLPESDQDVGLRASLCGRGPERRKRRAAARRRRARAELELPGRFVGASPPWTRLAGDRLLLGRSAKGTGAVVSDGNLRSSSLRAAWRDRPRLAGISPRCT